MSQVPLVAGVRIAPLSFSPLSGGGTLDTWDVSSWDDLHPTGNYLSAVHIAPESSQRDSVTRPQISGIIPLVAGNSGGGLRERVGERALDTGYKPCCSSQCASVVVIQRS
jgi:hypothetical protein